MDSLDSHDRAAARTSRIRPLLAVAALALLLLVAAGRWLSPNLLLGSSVVSRWCDSTSGYCVERVRRGEWVFLAPFDELQLRHGAAPRYYTADNPFGDADLTITWGDGVSVTDGTATLTWNAAALARLGD